VLVVDDNIFNIVAIQTILEELGVPKCDQALNGKQAVQMVEKRIQEIKRK
jgi:CheY-like chemotaxis protein